MFWIKMLTWQNEQVVIVWTVRRDKIKWPLERARRFEEVAVSGGSTAVHFWLFFLILSSLHVFACRTQAALRFYILCFVKLGRLREHRRQSRGSRGSVASPIEILGSPTPSFGAEKNFTDVFDNTCGHRRLQNAHFLPSDGTQELPKKHHEARPPEQLPTNVTTNVLSQLDYGHTRHLKPSRWCELPKYRF